ncbi:hypothetical protein PL8927_550184 [Planktothrix serta PCC 8927]|uniref:Uncharacterized protein n=1 Tax=Planktothrix serta PCC 8927 TaxID=671068 RepID=A0A7Z9DXV0_9CYAN|nr:hypothetical protein PL8927_550184 [Planktothrix serta PCC 8927]
MVLSRRTVQITENSTTRTGESSVRLPSTPRISLNSSVFVENQPTILTRAGYEDDVYHCFYAEKLLKKISELWDRDDL